MDATERVVAIGSATGEGELAGWIARRRRNVLDGARPVRGNLDHTLAWTISSSASFENSRPSNPPAIVMSVKPAWASKRRMSAG
jgi:hypothetical protein